MTNKNILVFTLLMSISTQIYGQAYRGYGGYMLGLWSIDWSKLNNQITELNPENFGMGSLENTLMMNGGGGGTYFTPIINYPEVSILGIGRSYKKQIFIKDKFFTRTVLPISLSYDHRIIDGAEAAKFCNSLKENLGKNFAYKLAV